MKYTVECHLYSTQDNHSNLHCNIQIVDSIFEWHDHKDLPYYYIIEQKKKQLWGEELKKRPDILN